MGRLGIIIWVKKRGSARILFWAYGLAAACSSERNRLSSRANLRRLVLTSGSGESISTILKSLASYDSSPFGACRPASAPRGLGTAEWGKTETRWNLCHRVPVGAPPGRKFPRKPEVQARHPTNRRRSAYLQVPRLFSGGGLPRPLPEDDRIDLRFTTIQCDSR
jgi:hypothetical protein